MGRHRDPAARAALLEAAADYVLCNGLSELSLRPLATGIGTSPRMLLYHFGSKEQLIVAVIEEARRRHADLLADQLAGGSIPDPDQIWRQFWPWVSSAEHAPFLRLFFEVYVTALRTPERYPGFLESAVTEWRELIENALAGSTDLPDADRRVLATLLLAAFRGLLLDLLATGDRARVEAAQNTLIAAVDAYYERAEVG